VWRIKGCGVDDCMLQRHQVTPVWGAQVYGDGPGFEHLEHFFCNVVGVSCVLNRQPEFVSRDDLDFDI
jgi:hypothetical protein